MILLVLGDCHADWSRLIAAIDTGHALHGVTAVIQVGDFGIFPIYIPLLLKAMAEVIFCWFSVQRPASRRIPAGAVRRVRLTYRPGFSRPSRAPGSGSD